MIHLLDTIDDFDGLAEQFVDEGNAGGSIFYRERADAICGFALWLDQRKFIG